MTRVERWEHRSEIPLLLLAVAFLVAYAWPVLDPRLNPDLLGFLTVLTWTTWIAFALDFTVRIVLAEDRLRYVVRHWYDVALIAIPLLRSFRLVRLVALARILNRAARSLVVKVSTYVAGAALGTIGLGAIAMLDAEQDAPGANIVTIGDALWWATTTVTTVGYGDTFPVTTTGRFLAGAVMFIGIALIGATTATFAAWIVEQLPPSRSQPPPTS
ncbi:MAG: potassium channel family protein [Nocardioides sp.]